MKPLYILITVLLISCTSNSNHNVQVGKTDSIKYKEPIVKHKIIVDNSLGAPVNKKLETLTRVKKIKWEELNLDTINRALDENKLMVIYIYSKNSYQCSRMDHITFQDPIVADFLNDKFIPIKLDIDTDADTIPEEFKTINVPSIHVVTPFGDGMLQVDKFLYPDDLAKILARLTFMWPN